jgi:ABC-type transport system involved in cytochrome bd biosynthesis fused ATPase/permease subunit
MRNLLYVVPRLLAVLAIAFISIFALDVFTEGSTPLAIAVGLAMHLLPSCVLIGVLAIAWNRPRIGAIAFLLVSVLPFFFLSNAFWVNTMLAGPFFLTGFLFALDAAYRD